VIYTTPRPVKKERLLKTAMMGVIVKNNILGKKGLY